MRPSLRRPLVRRWSMPRLGAALAVVLLVPLVACGDPTQDYCSDLEQHRKQIADLVESDSPSGLLGNLPMLRDLADKSPRDLTDEWQAFLGALAGLDDAIKDAGVKADDFKDGKPPAGLSEADRKAIAAAADQMGTDEVVQAASGIEQQARDVCKVNLGL
jgi:hypothetical protein